MIWAKSVHIPHVARSEEWRYFWCFRTCVSISVITFLLIFNPTKVPIIKYVNPAFAAFAAVLVKDVTLGATFVNCWTCIVGSFISSSIVYILFLILKDNVLQWNQTNSSTGVILLLLFFSVFIMQYAEILPMGKKLGVSLLAQNLLVFNTPDDPRKTVWALFLAVLFGCACAFVGTIIPLPVRTAGSEVKDRLHYCMTTMSALLRNSTDGWMLQPVKANYEQMARVSSLCNLHRSISPIVQAVASATTGRKEGRRWRKIRLLVNTVAAFRRSHRYCIGWVHSSQYRAKDIYTRVEVVKFLQDELEVLTRRNSEARFGPNRWNAIRIFGRYVSLVRNVLALLLQLEKHVQGLELQQEHHAIYRAFFLNPEFRRRFTNFVNAVCAGLEVLHNVLVPADYHQNPEGLVRAMLTMRNITECKELFNLEYLRLRKAIYYNVEHEIHSSSASLAGEIVEITPHQARHSLPLVTAVLFNMNTVIFLVETAGDLVLRFWSEEELKVAEVEVLRLWKIPSIDEQIGGVDEEIGGGAYFSVTTNDQEATSRVSPQPKAVSWTAKVFPSYQAMTSSGKKFLTIFHAACVDILKDLFPSQSHLVCVKVSGQSSADKKKNDEESDIISPSSSSSSSHWILKIFSLSVCRGNCLKISWRWTPVIFERCKSAFTVALAMTLAGAFGVYAQRPQPPLASFTIAYLAGGSVSGINILTCINRAAGTVVACVFTILVVYLRNSPALAHSTVGQDFIVGFAIVIFQLPSTYVRSFPLYSYSGTVAGFTAALLLINQEELSTEVAVTRIVDTYVGVFIYLLVELTMFAQMSESTLINTMRRTIEGIDQRFNRFYSHLVTGTHHHQLPSSPNAAANSGSRASRSAKTNSRTQRTNPFGDPVKTLELESMQILLQRQRELLPFYKSEPRLFTAPALPDSLLQEALHWQEQVVMALKTMLWVVQSCDDHVLLEREARFAKLAVDIRQHLQQHHLIRTNDKDVHFRPLSRKRSLHIVHPLPSRSSAASASVPSRPTSTPVGAAAGVQPHPSSTLPDYEAILLPLEDQYREVELYVSQALSYVVLALQEVQHPQVAIVAVTQAMRTEDNVSASEVTSSVYGGGIESCDEETGLLSTYKQAKSPLQVLRRITQWRDNMVVEARRQQRREKDGHHLHARQQQGPSREAGVVKHSQPTNPLPPMIPTLATNEKDQEVNRETIAERGGEVNDGMLLPQNEDEDSMRHRPDQPLRSWSGISLGAGSAASASVKSEVSVNITEGYNSINGKSRPRGGSMSHVCFGEVEGRQVERLFTSYQQLLNRIQAHAIDRSVASGPAPSSLPSSASVGQLSEYKLSPPLVHAPTATSSAATLPALHAPANAVAATSSTASTLPASLPSLPSSSFPSSSSAVRIPSNKELKVVNALLSCTKDLLQGLRSLSRVISRLQAHRDIRLTQDARNLST